MSASRIGNRIVQRVLKPAVQGWKRCGWESREAWKKN